MWDSTNLDKDKLPRLTYLPYDSLKPEMKDIFNSITGSERGVGTLSNESLPGPFNAWMYTDLEMANSLDKIGIAIRKNTTNVPQQMKEISICVIASHYRSNVEFWAHSRIAKKIGIDEQILDDIKHSRSPKFGKDIDGSDIKDDGISHKKEGGLKLNVKYETLENGSSKVFAKLV